MKKSSFIKSVSGAIIIGITISCSSSFLDVPLQGGINAANDPALAQQLVTGVYSSLLQGDSWGNGDVHGFAFLSVTNIISDDADKGSTAGDQAVPVGDIDNFTLTSTNKFCETLWSGHYFSIGMANQALAQLEKAAIDTALQSQFIGEVRFLRGYLYFNMVRMFGGVPLILRVPKDATDANTDYFIVRATKDQIYTAIIQDLSFALNHLPVRSKAAVGHATKGSAQTLLAKVYMYQGNAWDKVLSLTNDVILSNQYELALDYSTIWRQAGDNGKESIFEIESGYFNNDNLDIDVYTVCQGPRSGGLGGWNDLGWGFNDPSVDLVNSYEAGDLRKDATIIFIDNSGTHQGTILWDGFRIPSSDSVQNLRYNYKAYTSATKEQYANKSDKNRSKNIHILRYAEVLLMNAEAALHQGGDVATPLNLVRQRAGLGPIGSPTEVDIWKERRVELAMEHDRFWDLVRQGRAASVMIASGKTNFVAGKHELLPIPNSQVLLSAGKLTQNPNY